MSTEMTQLVEEIYHRLDQISNAIRVNGHHSSSDPESLSRWAEAAGAGISVVERFEQFKQELMDALDRERVEGQ